MYGKKKFVSHEKFLVAYKFFLVAYKFFLAPDEVSLDMPDVFLIWKCIDTKYQEK